MKILITIILFLVSIGTQAQTYYDKKQDTKITNLETWKTSITTWQIGVNASISRLNKVVTADSLRINTLTTQHFNQQSQINDLLTLTVQQSNDIGNLKTLTVLQQTQINKLQDSLKLIPFMRIDTTKNAGYPSLEFKNNLLNIIQCNIY